MIDTKELRIGNLVLCKGITTEVESTHHSQINVSIFDKACDGYGDDDKDLEGIPLTKELLTKCGFEKKAHKWMDGSISENMWWVKSISVTIEEWGMPPFMGRKTSDNNSIFICSVLYLHELQNAFFAVTKTELEIKL